jgi:hypothetical protein
LSSLGSAETYTIQAILPLSGPNATQYAQWATSIRLAVSEVCSSWALTNSLVVDILDYKGDAMTLQTLGTAAMANSSVIAVVSDDVGAQTLSGGSSIFQVRSFAPAPRHSLLSLITDMYWIIAGAVEEDKPVGA